jgi:hypothetical protein
MIIEVINQSQLRVSISLVGMKAMMVVFK